MASGIIPDTDHSCREKHDLVLPPLPLPTLLSLTHRMQTLILLQALEQQVTKEKLPTVDPVS